MSKPPTEQGAAKRPRFVAIWRRLDPSQRLIVASTSAVALVIIVALVWFAVRPESTPVPFANGGDALGSGTRTVLPHRAGSASAAPIGEDRRLQAEQTVRKMRGVVDASVTASASPSGGVQASITLQVLPEVSFPSVARAAIEQVAASTGVPEHSVTAIDAATLERYGGVGDDAQGATDSRAALEFLELQRARGAELERRAQALLDRLYPGRAVVAVTVELDPTWERSVERIQPDFPLVRSEQRSSGQPRVHDASADAGIGGSDVHETSARTYELFRGTRNRRMLAPELRRLSVALALDESIAPSKHASIEQAVKGAVGFSDYRDRGWSDRFELLVDTIQPEQRSGTTDIAQWAWVEPYVPAVGQILCVLLVLLFLRGLLARSGTRSARASTVAAAEDSVESASERERSLALRRQIENTIAEDPRAMSRLIDAWLCESKT